MLFNISARGIFLIEQGHRWLVKQTCIAKMLINIFFHIDKEGVNSPMKPLRGTQLKRFHRAFKKEHPLQHNIAAILQDVEYPVNVGSIFRIADAVKVDELILTGITPTPPNPTIIKAGRNKHTRVRWKYEKEEKETITRLKEDGYSIVALEIVEGAKPYYEVEWPAKTCLVVGHEDHGVTRATLEMCDDFVYIPMRGKGASLNVHVALAIVMFHIRYLEASDYVEGEEKTEQP